MISNGTIVGLAISTVLSTGTPFVVWFLLRRRMTLSWRNIGVGALTFFVAALVLEQVLHYLVLVANPAAKPWFQAHPWAYVAYGVIAAGIFEEIGRYIAMRRLIRPTGNPGTAIAYGLGHGGIEAVLLGGLSQIQGLVLAILFAAGMIGPNTPMLTTAYTQISHLTLPLAMIGGIERIIALTFQITISFVVWRAVETKRLWFLAMAIAFHAIGDCGAAMFQAGILHSVYLAEIWAVIVTAVIATFLYAAPKTAATEDFASLRAAR